MFRRRRAIEVPPPPDVKSVEKADEVLKEHRATLVRVKSIFDREVKRIDSYLGDKPA